MQELLNIMLDSGRTGVELSLYIILPIMVIMMAIMHVLDKKNILNWVAKGFSPLLILFGLPGLGVFAIIQILFISFAAPVSTLKIMAHDKSISDAGIAATLAAILVMAQANAVFPLAAVGLNVPVGIATSLIGGLIASFIAFKLSGGHTSIKTIPQEYTEPIGDQEKSKKLVPLLFEGGEAGLAIVLKSIPPLIIAIFMVNLFKRYGVIDFLEIILSPALTLIGIPTVAVLPIVTKFIAGGTAMMAIILDLMKEGAMSVTDLNRIAGFTLNPLDPVGLAVLMATGSRVTKVAKPAIIAAIIGIVIRGVLHLIIF
jgi:spore maturation protein SpmB